MSLTLRRRICSIQARGDDFTVIEGGRHIGRIYDNGPQYNKDTRWFWGVDFFEWEGCAKPQYGNAPSREDAMAAFKATWNSKRDGVATVKANKGNADLPQNRQPACRAIIARPFQIESTVRYLGIEVDDALSIAEQVTSKYSSGGAGRSVRAHRG